MVCLPVMILTLLIAADVLSQKVPGTIHTFEMIPVKSAPDQGAAKAFFVGKTEVSWDLLDAYRFELDRKAESKSSVDESSDIIARPSKPYIAMDRSFGHNGYPAISVQYRHARCFARCFLCLSFQLPPLLWHLPCRELVVLAGTGVALQGLLPN